MQLWNIGTWPLRYQVVCGGLCALSFIGALQQGEYLGALYGPLVVYVVCAIVYAKRLSDRMELAAMTPEQARDAEIAQLRKELSDWHFRAGMREKSGDLVGANIARGEAQAVESRLRQLGA